MATISRAQAWMVVFRKDPLAAVAAAEVAAAALGMPVLRGPGPAANRSPSATCLPEVVLVWTSLPVCLLEVLSPHPPAARFRQLPPRPLQPD